MAEYLSPSIEMVIPQLEQACDDLIRQNLVRALTEYPKKLCEFDPELADILLEGTKTLPRCIRYVLEKAQKAVAQQVEMMTEEESSTLPKVQVRGRSATLAGAAISDEEVFGGYGPTTTEVRRRSLVPLQPRKTLLRPKVPAQKRKRVEVPKRPRLRSRKKQRRKRMAKRKKSRRR